MKKRIGILGGNFNPIHNIHLMIADQVAQRMKLDKVYLMPEFLPPHVDEKTTIPAEHRLQMLELAISANARLAIEDCEIKRGGKSYSYDTMLELKAKHPDNDYFFIIGGDMVDYLPKWHRIDELIELVSFIAIQRGDEQVESKYPVTWLELPTSNLSSSDIREMIEQGIEPAYLVPEAVLEYIKENGLYQKNPSL
ncbi:nicotinate-nucleotide adenylyltransferase [Lactococcus termiticola]|uniref:Probable nicotinate-nucleotide adenylyltransferase n=1 Tax=Lactococcus termiticola TaxID=2169526 RepID=A0A2R5HH16_9LACT|nr:nicotinate-nucleotide adenylyltransferase [Lactococcus termiticola]GBG97357.1 nicotinic acid mononucleotide adenylyltransferase [Lactococcus termiticola]